MRELIDFAGNGDIPAVSYTHLDVYKRQVLAREKENGNIQLPALFVGDSKYDYQAATGAGLDFIFLSGWTEVADWQKFCEAHQITVKQDIKALLA